MATPTTLRSRHSATPNNNSTNTKPSLTPTKPNTTTSQTPHPLTRLSLLDTLRLLSTALLLSCTLSYFLTGSSLTWNLPRPAFTRPARIRAWLNGPLHLTPHQLSLYNGTAFPHLPILLALNNSIYDVSASPHIYGPGGSYHFFAGRDATRAFVTGCFGQEEGDLVGDLKGVEVVFVPVDEEDEDEDEGWGEGPLAGTRGMKELSKEERRERKVRREREWRVARRRVREVVEGWRRLFDGGKGGAYFKVGEVVRVEGEGEGKEEEGGRGKRGLCEKARRGRPRRGEEEGKGGDGGRGRG